MTTTGKSSNPGTNTAAATADVAPSAPAIATGYEGTIQDQFAAYVSRVRSGEMGMLPALAGLSVRTVKSIRQTVSSLSGGQRQTVAIARSVLWNSKVVILDEPTAALGVAQTEQVLKLVRRLADKGLAVVLISHNLNDVFQVADRISVLYLGRMAAQVRTADVTRNQVVELITGGQTEGVGAAPTTAPDAVETTSLRTGEPR